MGRGIDGSEKRSCRDSPSPSLSLLSNCICILWKRHPTAGVERPLIDYEVAALMMSGVLLGVIFGVLLWVVLVGGRDGGREGGTSREGGRKRLPKLNLQR